MINRAAVKDEAAAQFKIELMFDNVSLDNFLIGCASAALFLYLIHLISKPGKGNDDEDRFDPPAVKMG